MGDPYLSSDESLILSAHSISVDGISFDLMLTSRRLILIDNSVTPFQLHTIPLETIITVFAGTDAKGEPIITLSHMDITGSGAPHPMDIIFNRQKGEPRGKECDEWAATLDGQASRARDDALAAGTLPYDPVKVFQPRMSATYRIETFSPRRPAIGEYPVKAEPAPLPPVPEPETEERIPAGIDTPAPPAEAEWVQPSGAELPEPPAREEAVLPGADISGAGEFLSAPEVADAVTRSTEAVLPGAEISDAGEFLNVPEVADAVARSTDPVLPGAEISDAGEFLGVPEGADAVTRSTEPVQPEDVRVEEIPTEYEAGPVPPPVPPVSETAPGQTPEPGTDTVRAELPVESTEIPGITDTQRIWAEAVRSIVSTESHIPASVDRDAGYPGETASGETESIAADSGIIPENPVEERIESITPVEAAIPAPPASDEPVVSILSQSPQKSGPEIAGLPVAESSPVQKNQKRSTLAVLVAALVIVILVVLGGPLIGSIHLFDFPETTPPVVVPVITAGPTPTPVPTLVPAEGVWVRIEYPGIFIGEVGNPERMHPVYGSGVQLYKVVMNDPILKAAAQKQDNSGDTLIIEIYSKGSLIKRSSTRVPMGSVDILIDPITGKPPGIERGDIP